MATPSSWATCQRGDSLSVLASGALTGSSTVSMAKRASVCSQSCRALSGLTMFFSMKSQP